MQRLFVLCLGLFSVFAAEAYVAMKQNLSYSKACEPGDTYVISAVGDILLHSPLQIKASRAKDFSVLWRKFIPYFQMADMAYANLEGPTAYGVNSRGRSVRDPGFVFDKYVYTSYPMFNYHPSLVGDLESSGFDILSTANNHSLDRRSLGVDRTIEALESANMNFTGTRASFETERDRSWVSVVDRGGLKVAWIACTYSTNGIPDNKGQVLHCYKKSHRKKINSLVAEYSQTTDAVIVTPHWGSEYQHQPTKKQQRFAKEVLESGATAVIGAHPHVLQPMTKHITSDGRETFIIYSLGNFVSNQGQLPRRSTLVLFLGLTKNENGVHINGVKYLPAVMTGRSTGKELLPLPLSSLRSSARKHIHKLFSSEHSILYSSNPRGVVTNDHCYQ